MTEVDMVGYQTLYALASPFSLTVSSTPLFAVAAP